MLAALPGVLVREKLAGVETPVTLAVIDDPATVFAVTETLAYPLVSVVAVAPLGNVTLDPEDGPANVTCVLGTAAPLALVTLT